MAAASSSSSSDDYQIKHDVFISFSGKDTRRGFLSHLVKELRREKIKVYVDEKLNRGEEISSSLRRAIQESKISIVIFSENYASSRWCLDELAEIFECMKVNKQIVLPVFYYIDPSYVRHQKGTYENAFADHELKFQGNGLKVQNWRSALKKAADLSGYDSSRYRQVTFLREVTSKFNATMQIAVPLISRSISELQEEKCTSVQKRLLSRRKVFVVLDDVDTPEQLQHLVTEGIRLLDFSKAQKIEWENICACESSCNVSPHIFSFSMIAALNLACSKDSKTVHSECNFRAIRDFDVGLSFNVKVFSLSAEEISELDIGTSKFEMLHSSIGGLSEILPINESRCLISFEELSFSNFRQMDQGPDTFGSYSSLVLLVCLNINGSIIDSLPASIKNLPSLKTICLRNCRMLRSIPELPPSIMHLEATNCTSLETVFTITTSAPQHKGILSYCFDFVNCLKLDEHSLCDIMDNAYLSLKRAVHNNFEASYFCYPSRRVPKWFEFKQATEASLTMQLSPFADTLLGFVFGVVLPQTSMVRGPNRFRKR